MTERQFVGFNLTLKNSEESQLRAIYSQYVDLTGHVDLAQFFKFCYEKLFITNQSPIYAMFNIFNQAAGDKPYLNKARFFYAISLLGRLLYPEDIVPLDPMLNRLISGIVLKTCYPVFDDALNSLLTENVLRLFQKTEVGFFDILTSYNTENIKKGRKVKGAQEIKAKNLGISPRNLLRYFKMKGGVIPDLLKVEDFQNILQEVFPATDSFTRKYFTYGHLVKFYYNDNNIITLTRIKDIYGEPELRLNELQLVFGKVALVGYRNIEDPFKRVFQLLETKLGLSTKSEIQVKYSFEEDPYILFGEVGKPKEILKEFEMIEYTLIENVKEKFDLSSVIKNLPPIPSMEDVEKYFDIERVPQIPPPEKITIENPPPFVLPPIKIPLKVVNEVKYNITLEKKTPRA